MEHLQAHKDNNLSIRHTSNYQPDDAISLKIKPNYTLLRNFAFEREAAAAAATEKRTNSTITSCHICSLIIRFAFRYRIRVVHFYVILFGLFFSLPLFHLSLCLYFSFHFALAFIFSVFNFPRVYQHGNGCVFSFSFIFLFSFYVYFLISCSNCRKKIRRKAIIDMWIETNY